MNKTLKYILSALIGGVIVFALIRGCGRGEKTVTLAQFDALVANRDSIAAASNSRISILAQGNDRLRAEKDSALREAAQAKVALSKVRPTVIRLAGQIITKMDSVKCDSLARLQADLLWLIEDYGNSLTFAIIKADSIEYAKNEEIDEYKKQLAACNKALDFAVSDVIPVLKPRGQLFLGGDIIGNRATIFSGYGADLSWLNKTGQIYSVGSAWINGEQYYRAGAKFRLSFRKH